MDLSHISFWINVDFLQSERSIKQCQWIKYITFILYEFYLNFIVFRICLAFKKKYNETIYEKNK